MLDWVAVGLGWLGTALVGQRTGWQKNLGWLLWVVASAIWTWYGYSHGITGLMVSSLGYLVFELLGLIKGIRNA